MKRRKILTMTASEEQQPQRVHWTMTDRPQRHRKSVSHYSDDNPNTFTVKRKKGQAVALPVHKAVHKAVKRSPPSSTPRSFVPPVLLHEDPPPKRKRLVPVPRPPPSPVDTILTHTRQLHPILPPSAPTLPPRWAAPPPPAPQWRPLVPPYPTRTAHDAHGTPMQLPPAQVTAWNGRWTGDATGLVTCYNHNVPVTTIHTQAHQRHQQRPLLSKTVEVFGSAIVALCSNENWLCVQAVDGTELYRCSFDGTTPWTLVQELPGSPIPYGWDWNANGQLLQTGPKLRVWSLAQEPQWDTWCEESLEGVCHAAVWEDETTVLAVVGDASLVRATQTSLQRVKVPDGGTDYHIQLDHDQYICLATHKGILVYDRPTLSWLITYGESVALHGKSMVWGSSAMWSVHSYPKAYAHKKRVWYEARDDEEPQSELMVVGVPHPTKGPSELASTIYLWKPGHLVPAATILAPPGGIQTLTVRGQQLTVLGNGTVWTWTPTQRSNFAGTMYPVGYQLLTDNIDYIEDEDELDHVVVEEGKEADDDQDEDSVAHVHSEDAPVQVLLEDEEAEPSLIPCRPDPFFQKEDVSSPLRSPERGGESEPLLSEFPQWKLVRSKLDAMAEQQQTGEVVDEPGNGNQDDSKPKGKRNRPSNVEALLHSSIDSNLRHLMAQKHQVWGNGAGSVLQLSDLIFAESCRQKRLSQTKLAAEKTKSATTDEEKELAFELLFLSPKKAPTSTEPSENGEAIDKEAVGNGEATNGNHGVSCEPGKPPCAACQGRLVVHICGKREKPIDYELLARKQREEEARAEAEKQRQRAEKRKAADARRREARRKKKEDEERARQEEALRIMEEDHRRREEVKRMRELEAEEFARAHMREAEDRPSVATIPTYSQYSHATSYEATTAARPSLSIPKFSEIMENSSTAQESHRTDDRYMGMDASTSSSVATTNNFGQPQAGSQHEHEQDPSASIPRHDALAALAAFAGSMSKVEGTTPAPTPSPVATYDYAGSIERRSAILAQLNSQAYAEMTRTTQDAPSVQPLDGAQLTMAQAVPEPSSGLQNDDEKSEM